MKLHDLLERRSALILLIVVFFPLGLYLMWQSSAFSLKAKRLWTASVLVVFVIGGISRREKEAKTTTGETGVPSSASSTSTSYSHSREEMEGLFKTLVFKVRKGMTRTAVVGLLGEPDTIQKNDLGEFNPAKDGQMLEILTWGTKDDADSFIMLSFVNGTLNGGGSTGYDIETGFKQK